MGVILCLGLFHGISNLDFFTSLKTIVTASKNPKKSSGNPVRFRQQGVQQIEITSLKTKIMKTFIDENDMETITSGIDNAKKKQLLLDEESADMIDCTMRINYKGGSTQTYYIWARNKSKEVVIGRQENLKGLYFESYELNKDYSKKITKLLKNII